jgi:TetR/AcrR family transcriptional regulator, cholesterol catabolism regulator
MPKKSVPETRPGRSRRPVEQPASSPRRTAILALAAQLFAERGFRATTVRDIADAAGMLSGSLYHHFDSKESMVDELLSSFLNDLLARCRSIAAEDRPPREALERMVEEAFDALPRHRAAIVVFQHDAAYLTRYERFRYLDSCARELEDLWVGVLRRGVDHGDLVCPDPELTYRFIRDAVWMSVHWYRLDGALTTRDLSRRYLRVLLAGLAPR